MSWLGAGVGRCTRQQRVELAQLDGLEEIVGDPAREQLAAQLKIGAAGHDHDSGRQVTLPDVLDDEMAMAAGQSQIHERHVRGCARQPPQGFFDRGGGKHVRPTLRQIGAQALEQIELIFDDQVLKKISECRFRDY